MKKYIILFLFLFQFKADIYSQNNYNFRQFYDESFKFIEQPLKWQGADWIKFGSLAAGTYLISLADKPIQENALKNQKFVETVPELTGRYWGQGYATAAFILGFGIHGLATDNKSSKKIAFEIIQATIYAGGIAQFLKMTIGRARPYANEGNASFHPFSIFDDSHLSFPSGDVTTAFTLSAVLANNSKSDLLKLLCYVPAVLTVSSRIYRDAHWASDAFFGAAVGIFVGNWVTNTHQENENSLQMSSVYPLSIRIKL